MYFDKPGRQNTDETLSIAFRAAADKGIGHVVVASTTGETGDKAAGLFSGSGVQLLVIAHNTGFGDEGEWEFDPDVEKRIIEMGGKVYRGTMPLRGLGTAVRKKGGYSDEMIVADTLRILGQGIKVCVEMAAMAVDAGIAPVGDILCVDGTGRGADTCAVVAANSSNRFFDIRVREIFARPVNS